jgi:hypothetical protein
MFRKYSIEIKNLKIFWECGPQWDILNPITISRYDIYTNTTDAKDLVTWGYIWTSVIQWKQKLNWQLLLGLILYS